MFQLKIINLKIIAVLCLTLFLSACVTTNNGYSTVPHYARTQPSISQTEENIGGILEALVCYGMGAGAIACLICGA